MTAAIINIAIAIGFLFYAAVPGVSKTAADNYYVVCPLIIAFAVTSLWEINRNVRHLNLLTGAWLALAPFVLAFPHLMPKLVSILGGVVIFTLSLFPRSVKGRYGGGWISLFQSRPPHISASST